MKIFIIAGEASGDRHAADLVRELKQISPQIKFYGIGGDRMKEEGVHLYYHIRQMAFLGFLEIVKHIPFIKKVFKTLKLWMRKEEPAMVILVDYPGFNLRLAKIAKKQGIPVVYYICPQLWAWHEKRIEKIRQWVDLPLVIFSFEENYYARHGIQANFVGHPLIDQIKIDFSESEFREKHGLSDRNPIVALLPGSRENEVKSLLPVMVETASKFQRSEKLEWVVGKAAALPQDLYKNILGDNNSIKIVEKDIHYLIKYAYAGVVASGTATLEMGYLGTPMVVLYKVYPLTYLIGKKLVKVKNIALANIVSGEKVVPELIQNDANPHNVAQEIQKYLSDKSYYDKVKGQLSRIREILGPPGASNRAAQEISHYFNL